MSLVSGYQVPANELQLDNSRICTSINNNNIYISYSYAKTKDNNKNAVITDEKFLTKKIVQKILLICENVTREEEVFKQLDISRRSFYTYIKRLIKLGKIYNRKATETWINEDLHEMRRSITYLCIHKQMKFELQSLPAPTHLSLYGRLKRKINKLFRRFCTFVNEDGSYTDEALARRIQNYAYKLVDHKYLAIHKANRIEAFNRKRGYFYALGVQISYDMLYTGNPITVDESVLEYYENI